VSPRGRTRLLTITLDGMGWATYRRALAAAAEHVPDVESVHVAFLPRGAYRLWSAPLPGGRGRFDSHVRRIAVAARVPGRWAADVDLRRFDVVHVTPQQYAVGLLDELARAGTPLSVGFDATVLQAKGELGDASPEEVRRDFAPLVEAEAAVYAAADRLVAMNRWAARSAAGDFGVPEEKIVVVPPGLPPAPAATSTRRVEPGPPRIAFVGHDWRRKGGDRLLRWHRDHWQGRAELVLCSAGAPRHRLPPGVVVHRALPYAEVRGTLLPSADLFVLPTRKDMSPWAVLEAAAAGLPVVTSDIGALREMVVDGVTGYLVPPDDDDGFVSAVESLLEDPGRRARMGLAARRHVAANFDAESSGDRLLAAVVSLAGHSGPEG
jgi:glycosyltransferase involved in cell wall biosynthesis